MVFWIIGGFSLEVIWGQSPLKFRLNNFEDPAVARADIVDYSMIKMCYLSCSYRVYMLINKYDEWRLVHSQAKTPMVLCIMHVGKDSEEMYFCRLL